MSVFLPGEPPFTQHRAGWKAAQWASAPNIDVILLISTLSLLLISLISAWSAGEQQQTQLFFLSSLFIIPRTPTYSEKTDSFFFSFLKFISSLPPESLAQYAYGLSIRAVSILLRFSSPELCNHTEWVEAFHPSWLNWFCSKEIIRKEQFGAQKAALSPHHDSFTEHRVNSSIRILTSYCMTTWALIQLVSDVIVDLWDASLCRRNSEDAGTSC